jgi:hypothetical protein
MHGLYHMYFKYFKFDLDQGHRSQDIEFFWISP